MPPMFHEPRYTTYGTIVPGEFDIGCWFRPFNVEIQLWKPAGELVIEEGEPLFYMQLQTEKKVVLKRFKTDNELIAYALSGAESPNKYGKRLPLVDRYKRFKETSMRELVLQGIEKNLITYPPLKS
jgi:hypothetical protein